MKTIDMKEMKTIDMKEAMRLVAEGTTVSAAQRHALQQQRLRELVGYAREHSPWFAQHYADVPDDFTLTDLPYTEKATLLEHYNDWVTDRELTLDGVTRGCCWVAIRHCVPAGRQEIRCPWCATTTITRYTER